ncbi:hypothetical protein HF086_014541 [Spodoptera exigua]|uniref:Uncharacterized protein n=2 Tax=Spodoptera exigua TaxID=7107 RepID=A0A922M8P5_SPOEX|nr:hypothetical protein HF086_014541 [Spodoptera exigua]
MPRTTRSAQRSARSSDDDDTVVESRTHAGAAHTHVACDGDAPERRAQGGAAQEPDYMFDGGRSGAPAHSALSTERLLTTMMESFARAQADTNRILVETLRSLHHNGNQWNPVTSTPTASPTANTFTTFGGNFSKCTARFDGQSRNAEVLEAFVDAVEVYKECAGVSNEHAVRGLSMLLTGDAAVWWRGARPSVGTWPDALARLRATYGIGWFWTLFMTLPYVFLTSYTTCCGKRNIIGMGHLSRLLVATVFWYTWTTVFNMIETNYGRCNTKLYDNKIMCLKNGHFWNGFDISGHCFILIYSSLVMIEEAKAINGWERIKDYIRDEKYARSIDDKSASINPLKNITSDELSALKVSYENYTPYVRAFLIGIALLQLLWDVMLVSTILYYHIMVEKFISGVIAILTWFVTYRVWYTIPNIYPNLPGEGIFKYNNKTKPVSTTPTYRKKSSTNGKHFMGMPINANQDSENGKEETK